jgi:hypothetical protein
VKFLLAALMLAGGAWLAAQTAPVVRTFDDDRVDAPPPGFGFAEKREAARSRWIVQREADGHVLAHLQEPAPSGGFALAVLDDPHGVRVRASVRVKLVSGRRTAGLVWGYHDRDNYHVAWLNLSEQRVGIYRFTSGNRVRLRSEDELELDPGAWHTLKVVYERDSLKTYLGGIKVFDLRSRGTGEAGRVGVWSADDTVAYFDDLRVEYPPIDQRDETPRR